MIGIFCLSQLSSVYTFTQHFVGHWNHEILNSKQSASLLVYIYFSMILKRDQYIIAEKKNCCSISHILLIVINCFCFHGYYFSFLVAKQLLWTYNLKIYLVGYFIFLRRIVPNLHHLLVRLLNCCPNLL